MTITYFFILLFCVNTVTVFTREKQAPPYHCYIHLGYKGHVCYISVNYNNPKDQNPQRCLSLRNATSSSFVFCHPGKSTLLIDRHRLTTLRKNYCLVIRFGTGELGTELGSFCLEKRSLWDTL